MEETQRFVFKHHSNPTDYELYQPNIMFMPKCLSIGAYLLELLLVVLGLLVQVCDPFRLLLLFPLLQFSPPLLGSSPLFLSYPLFLK